MTSLPAPTDVQVATNWPVVDEYRTAVERLMLARAKAAHARVLAKGRVMAAAPVRQQAEAVTAYEMALMEVPAVERAVWLLEIQARRLGDEVEGPLGRARLGLEARAATRQTEWDGHG